MCCDSRSSPQVSTCTTFSSRSKTGVWRGCKFARALKPAARHTHFIHDVRAVRAARLLSGRLSVQGKPASTKPQCGNNAACPVPTSRTKSFFFKSGQPSINRGTSNCWQRELALVLV